MGWWSGRLARWQSANGAVPPKDRGWAVLSTVIAAIVTTGAILYVVTGAPEVLTRHLHYNWSPSLPRGFYRPSFPDSLARGDLVRVCLPEAHAALALERKYLYPGLCPGGTEPLAKVVVALPGDTVLVDSTLTHISGGLVIHAPVVTLDSQSRPVPSALGEHVLLDGECFVLSTYIPHNYDSRYFGAVDCSAPHVVLTAADDGAQAAIDSMRRDMLGE